MTMRVLLSERNFKGHRKTYMKWLSKIPGIEFYVLAPDNIGVEADHYCKVEYEEGIKNFREYWAWIILMKQIVRQEKIDVLHILDGDSIMRWFGIGFNYIKAPKIIITYHHFFPGVIRRISYWLMCFGRNRLCVAHTASVEKSLRACGLKNVVHCEYPAFSFDSITAKNSAECKNKYGIPLHVPTIGIVGGLSKYKNIIPFLDAIRELNTDFHVLICGQGSDVTEDEIKKAIEPYTDKVTLCIKYLSDKEYEEAIVASDIIFCVYGHEFDGASGPLTDGVCAEKFILSCKHGSLGEIVSQNLLGITVESDDMIEIKKQTELALSHAKNFKYGEIANKYREGLNPATFQKTYSSIYFSRNEELL